MYTIEKVKTRDFSPTGLPIWEVVVRDHKGHAVHHRYCAEPKLSAIVAELRDNFCAQTAETQNP